MKWRTCLLAALVLVLAGCGSSRPRPTHGHHGGPRAAAGRHDGLVDDVSRPQDRRYRDSDDSVPTGPLDVSKLVEPVPRIEPRSLYGNKSPYTVLGKTYTVLPSAHGYDERGIASFYGNKFHGYKTSSLETYDMYAFSAAHKTLPLPSYARVTNLDNGKSVVVRINDRGPFHAGRLIDLSYAAAVKIGVWPRGTGRVEVRAIDPADPQAPVSPSIAGGLHAAPMTARMPEAMSGPAADGEELQAASAVPSSGASPGIYLQVGAFSEPANAERLARQLREAHLGPVRTIDGRSNGQNVRRVQVGPLEDIDRADQISARIEDMGLPRPQLAVD
jgi:rare lipoprotein A